MQHPTSVLLQEMLISIVLGRGAIVFDEYLYNNILKADNFARNDGSTVLGTVSKAMPLYTCFLIPFLRAEVV